MPSTSLAGVADLAQRRVPAELALHGAEGVDEAADAVRWPIDLAAHVAQAVGQLVGTRGQPVEITRAGR